MNLHIEPITEDNRREAEELQVAREQKGYVESVTECLEEASHRKCWRPVGIYDGEKLVGFAMYGFFWMYFPAGRVWLDRLLIDRHYQGQGYGKAALETLLERLHQEYHRNKIYLSVVEGNDVAAHLYEKEGFSFNGELDIHGEHVMVYQFGKLEKNTGENK